MQIQDMQLKIIQIGNSQGVILPKALIKGLKIKAGNTIEADLSEEGVLLKKPNIKQKKSSLTPEFKAWLDKTVAKHEYLIKELAKR